MSPSRPPATFCRSVCLCLCWVSEVCALWGGGGGDEGHEVARVLSTELGGLRVYSRLVAQVGRASSVQRATTFLRHSTKSCDSSRQCVRLPTYFLIAPPFGLNCVRLSSPLRAEYVIIDRQIARPPERCC